jgi:hypothetical protein
MESVERVTRGRGDGNANAADRLTSPLLAHDAHQQTGFLRPQRLATNLRQRGLESLVRPDHVAHLVQGRDGDERRAAIDDAPDAFDQACNPASAQSPDAHGTTAAART